MIFLFIIIGLIFLFWLIGFFYQNDFGIPTKSIKQFKKILLIFPHPDDETITAAGLIHQHYLQGGKTTVHILTRGEKGTDDAHLDSQLKQTRSQELKNVAQILGVTKLIHDDLGDGTLKNKRPEIARRVAQIIKQENPDLIITYDLAGKYGHPDHIIVSEVITELVTEQFKHIVLWYASDPPRLKNIGNLPEHMAEDPEFKKRKTTATHKVFIGLDALKKIQALHAHTSQFPSFRKAFPYKPIPAEFFMSQSWYEYFYEVK